MLTLPVTDLVFPAIVEAGDGGSGSELSVQEQFWHQGLFLRLLPAGSAPVEHDLSLIHI